jgi:hypothetical protein
MSNLTGIPSCQSGVGVNEFLQPEAKITITESGDRITFESASNFEVAFYSTSGVQLYRQSYNAGSHTVSKHHYAKGLYIIEVKNGQGREIRKLSIQ